MPKPKIAQDLDEVGQAAQEELAHEKPTEEEPAKAKRDRGWEETRRRSDKLASKTQVSYRGVPQALNADMKALAREKGITLSELAAQLLAYGMEQQKAGNLTIKKGRRK